MYSVSVLIAVLVELFAAGSPILDNDSRSMLTSAKRFVELAAKDGASAVGLPYITELPAADEEEVVTEKLRLRNIVSFANSLRSIHSVVAAAKQDGYFSESKAMKMLNRFSFWGFEKPKLPETVRNKISENVRSEVVLWQFEFEYPLDSTPVKVGSKEIQLVSITWLMRMVMAEDGKWYVADVIMYSPQLDSPPPLGAVSFISADFLLNLR